jgi:hypothetical protein
MEAGMSLLEAVTLGATVLFVVAVFYATTLTGRRMLRDAGRLRLFELLGARGLALPAAEGEATARDSALAVRRCAACHAHAECDRLLATRDWQRLQQICPNATYVENVAAAAR